MHGRLRPAAISTKNSERIHLGLWMLVARRSKENDSIVSYAKTFIPTLLGPHNSIMDDFYLLKVYGAIFYDKFPPRSAPPYLGEIIFE
jgi:hypothetical protein